MGRETDTQKQEQRSSERDSKKTWVVGGREEKRGSEEGRDRW